jgi:hypothetical protein
MSSTSAIETYGAITNFVNDLWEVFGDKKKITPLALYHRLIEHITLDDPAGMQKAIQGFQVFFATNAQHVISGELDKIPKGTKIPYNTGKTAYLEIQKYIHQASEEIRESIHQHLLTIGTLLKPNKEMLNKLVESQQTSSNTTGEASQIDASSLNIDTSTKEGKFIKDIIESAKTSVEGLDMSNPTAGIISLFQSGVLQKMIGGINESVGSGDIDPRKLIGTMQSALSALMPAESNNNSPPKVVDITDKVPTIEKK